MHTTTQGYFAWQQQPGSYFNRGWAFTYDESLPLEWTYVIAQLKSTILPASKLAAFLDYMAGNELQRYELAPGLVSVFLSHRACGSYAEVMMFSIWTGEDLMLQFIEQQATGQTLKSAFDTLSFEPRVYDFAMSRDGRFRATNFSSEAAD